MAEIDEIDFDPPPKLPPKLPPEQRRKLSIRFDNDDEKMSVDSLTDEIDLSQQIEDDEVAAAAAAASSSKSSEPPNGYWSLHTLQSVLPTTDQQPIETMSSILEPSDLSQSQPKISSNKSRFSRKSFRSLSFDPRLFALG